ncbi:MAG: CopG family transcriptional regulator [Acidobacteria bacterium RIFCSPLOWO2_02_FULL_65_29]|nr:MAG: CopG family transcriptional regulator [Acidobacteria bacterium RIFCSPLOWO2_02_FULL_65_29]
MRTVQMTIEPELVARVDKAARRLGLTRSSFTRRALVAAIEQLHVQELERRHREGYRQKPAHRGEFDAWAAEQVWPD